MSTERTHRIKSSFYWKAKNLGFTESALKQAIEVYKEEFYRYPKTIGDLLEVLE